MTGPSKRSTPRATSRPRDMTEVVLDATALVDLLLANDLGVAVRERIAGQALHAPSHVDAEVLSALGRLHRGCALGADEVETKLDALTMAPIRRHPTGDLLLGAWSRRHQLRLADALYVELAVSRRLRLVTTDRRLHVVPSADIVGA